LNEINADKDDRLRYHILENKGKKKKRIQTREEKIFILANDCLTGDPSVHDLSLIQVSIATSVFIATGQHSYVLVIQ
jgi:ATP-dependent DNA helicase HFM1/MER3